MKVAIIGAGVLGTSLGILLRRAGYEIAAVCSPNRRSARVAATLIGAGDVVGDNGLAAMGADLVLLAVPDRAIPSVAIEVSAGGALRRGAVVAHCAGGLPAGVLSGVTAAGGHRGAIHPLQSFADVDTAVRMLPDTFFFLEGDSEAVDVLRSVVIALDGRPVEIQGSNKAVYHAAASAASNFLVTLVDYAVTLLHHAGVPRDAALAALLPLIRGTVENLEAVGLPDALTGPIARGDIGTVKRHVRALEKLPGDLVQTYRILARKTIGVAQAKGTIDADAARQLLDILEGPSFSPG
ncbi:MAG: DUF2520 domain-containing protein [Planctomycetota bacterium]|nr:DUF2520 domain-containing protein [Planctomycetota bacterium]